jgi:mRNA-degrading endonuclease RelE of RelBE toxin-antitoxin system
VKILQTPTFIKQLKKLHANQKRELDLTIIEIAQNPQLGDMKKGDLSGVQVYKFTMIDQLMLLAYEWHPDKKQLILLTLGSHENFYRDLKKSR